MRSLPPGTASAAQGSGGLRRQPPHPDWTNWDNPPPHGQGRANRRAGSRALPGSRRRKRRKGDKTALVLGGGGFTGGVYEIGALRALDLLAVNTTVNEFDVYVGTSAGSFVASMTANGVTPEEMMRVLNKALPSPIEDPKLRHLLRPNYGAWATKMATMPLRVVGTLRHLAGNIGEVSMVDVVDGPGRGAADGRLQEQGARGLHGRGALGPRSQQRLPRARAASCC